ncbi:MAG: exodeoxyribonuclease VII small subunit [Coriobacteriia bacterium]|nr:exodeoxyribonuclease VII small subunit [Coriobacteriia bacterium]
MSEERYTFEQARARLEEIASLVRKKDTSLERSLELLEESVRLANVCTELVDRTDLGATAASGSALEAEDASADSDLSDEVRTAEAGDPDA